MSIVTGGTSCIGLAVAVRLASEGARLVLVDLNEDALTSTLSVLNRAGAPEVWLSMCDVAVEAQVEATIQGTPQRFGRVDVMSVVKSHLFRRTQMTIALFSGKDTTKRSRVLRVTIILLCWLLFLWTPTCVRAQNSPPGFDAVL